MVVLPKHIENDQRTTSTKCFGTREFKVNIRLKVVLWDVGIIRGCPVNLALSSLQLCYFFNSEILALIPKVSST